jgi:excisionase family DNA binding protein
VSRDQVLTPGNAAKILGVDAKTLVRWAREGRVPTYAITLGGHRRYLRSDIEALVDGQPISVEKSSRVVAPLAPARASHEFAGVIDCDVCGEGAMHYLHRMEPL